MESDFSTLPWLMWNSLSFQLNIVGWAGLKI